MASDNSAQMSRVKRNLLRALREDVTPRQREMLLLYYGEQLNMRQIGTRLGVDKSTVSRTIKRGERRLQRCLRYGAEAFLAAD
jgi:RNA polymerase sigma factor, sigma-70 family